MLKDYYLPLLITLINCSHNIPSLKENSQELCGIGTSTSLVMLWYKRTHN